MPPSSEWPKSIRVDSRFRAPSSRSSTDFAIQLSNTYNLPEDVVCRVTTFVCDAAWWNVEEGVSDRLYVRESRTVGGAPQVRCRAIQVPAGNYTAAALVVQLATSLNTGSLFANSLVYETSYVQNRGVIRVSLSAGGSTDATARFRVLSESELLGPNFVTLWTGDADSVNTNDLDSMSDLLRIPAASADTVLWESGLLNVSPTNILLLHFKQLTSISEGPRQSDNDVILSVPVDVSYGFTLAYQSSGSSEDYFHCGGMPLNYLEFTVTNVWGRPVNLHGGSVYFTLEFSQLGM